MATPRYAGLMRVYGTFERAIIIFLLGLLMLVVLWSTVSLGIGVAASIVVRVASGTPVAESPLMDIISRQHLLHDVFGAFLLILIGVELMKTVVMYLSAHELHVEVVFTVAMIAIARHAIDINLKEMTGSTMLGMGVLVVTLAVAYYLFRKAATMSRSEEAGGSEADGP